MSARELARAGVLARVAAGTLRLRAAAAVMAVSYRQAKRLYQRYRAEGAQGLTHRSAGRRSNAARAEAERTRILALVRKKYSGSIDERFGPTLAAEHLATEDGVQVHHDTLRRWMLAAGLWSRTRKRSPYRRRRERKAHFGELVQLDGSFHAWFERRGPARCLLTLVDDATGRSTGRFSAQETIWAAVAVVRDWIAAYGIPQALYTDWKNVYVRPPTEEERLTQTEPLTQFGRMCAQLGIRIIPASSPQAKGRVERNHGTHQDRLVKKLRRKAIADLAAANAFLETEYWADHNRRFARVPASADDFHVAVPRGVQLDAVFRLQETRTVSNDWVVRYANRYFQLERQSQRPPARSIVHVYEAANGQIDIRYRDRVMRYRELPPAQVAAARATPPAAYQAGPPPAPRTRRPAVPAPNRGPSADHPWQ
ncbi:MAG TPA: ISNCY family transposase, partial [Longimicrobium sp.]|nr:ISNCY family transposase [Longimicrobium sp.]